MGEEETLNLKQAVKEKTQTPRQHPRVFLDISAIYNPIVSVVLKSTSQA